MHIVHDGYYFCQVITKSIEVWQSYGPDTEKRPFFLSLTSKCDLDLRATDLGLARDTLSHHGQHFYQVISESIEEWQNY